MNRESVRNIRSRVLSARQLAALLSVGMAATSACSGTLDPAMEDDLIPVGSGSVAGPLDSTGGVGSGPVGTNPSSGASGMGSSGGPAGSGTDTGPAPSPSPTTPPPPSPEEVAIAMATPVTRLRLLTQAEYKASVAALLATTVPDTLILPDDNPVAGFGSVGASTMKLSELSAEQYETASQLLARQVFSDEQAWQALVGCQPQTSLQEACVEDYVRSFGRRAFRRDLTDTEVSQWLTVARTASAEAEDAATGLALVTSGLLQSPHFLYRAEHADPDLELLRLKYDGPSMATRLAYAITGASPSDELLSAAAAGELDTTEGIRQAAIELMNKPEAAQFMADFFIELTQLRLATVAERDPAQFPQLTESLREAMLEEVYRWVSQVVLAQGADVRALFNSPTTFVNAELAEFYGLDAPQGQGFQQVQLPRESGRSGILGKAGFIIAHSSPDSTNPTRRGNFILKSFTCTMVPPPPADLVVTIPKNSEGGERKTTRELFEAHRIDATCISCHSVMDPFGFALEHFDPIGAYRETEDGMTIDAASEFAGATFDGAVELGEVLYADPSTAGCFLQNFYRYLNGTPDDKTDGTLIKALAKALQDNNYVWRDAVIEFVTSDAFTSYSPLAISIQPDPEEEPEPATSGSTSASSTATPSPSTATSTQAN